MTRRLAPAAPALAALAVAALALTGCSGGDDAEPAPAPSATQESDDSSASPSESASPEASPAADTDLGAVIALAESEVDGSRAWELDRRDTGGWEVSVVAGDTEHDVWITPAGDSVEETRESDRLDPDDRAELEGATVSIQDAIETAMVEVPGLVDGATLDADDGVIRWEVDILPDGQADSVDVLVDAGTGEVLGTDR